MDPLRYLPSMAAVVLAMRHGVGLAEQVRAVLADAGGPGPAASLQAWHNRPGAD